MTSQSGSGGTSTLSGDTDVLLTTPAANNLLGYDGTHWINFIFNKVLCHNAVAFSVPNNADTAITFDTNDFDVGGLHSTTVNTSRITVQKAGDYLVGGTASYGVSATGVRHLHILKNGAGVGFGAQYYRAADSGATNLSTVFPFHGCIVGDFFELITFQSSGGALATDPGGGEAQTDFWATRIP